MSDPDAPSPLDPPAPGTPGDGPIHPGMSQPHPAPAQGLKIPPRVDPQALTANLLLQADRRCNRCGYSLQGLPRDSLCPECATPVIDSLQAEDLDSGAQVSFERKCRQCSYELLGLPLNANCPECGTPVRASLRADELRYSSRDYLIILRRGLVMAGILSLLAILNLLLPSFFLVSTGSLQASVTILTLGIWSVFQTAMVAIAWWIVTQPDAASPAHRDIPETRMWLRVSVVSLAVVNAARLITALLMTGRPALAGAMGAGNPSPASIIADLVIGLASFVAVALWFVTSMMYVRWICQRLPDRNLANLAQAYIWVLPLVYIVLFCACIGPMIAHILFAILLFQIAGRLGGVIQHTLLLAPPFATPPALPVGTSAPPLTSPEPTSPALPPPLPPDHSRPPTTPNP